MKELMTDFSGLKDYTKKSSLKFRQAVIDYYRQLGEKNSFTVLLDSSVIRTAFNFGKVDLIWVEPNIVFCTEFGVLDDIYKHLWRIMILKPSMAVLLLSGNSQCNPKKVKEIIVKTPHLDGIEFVVIDVTSCKTV